MEKEFFESLFTEFTTKISREALDSIDEIIENPQSIDVVPKDYSGYCIINDYELNAYIQAGFIDCTLAFYDPHNQEKWEGKAVVSRALEPFKQMAITLLKSLRGSIFGTDVSNYMQGCPDIGWKVTCKVEPLEED